MFARVTGTFLETKGAVRVVAVIGLLLFVATNLPWHLDDYDQAKQAYTSFEMVKEGHWLYQHTPHDRIATKPPLVGWISAALYLVTRSWTVAWRLPSFAAAVALAILLFRAGAIYGPTGSWVASSAFVFNLLSPRLATLVRTDMPLALAVFAIGVLFWNKVRLNEKWTRRDKWLLFALLTAAMLIKGPIVYAFLLPGLIVAALYERRITKHQSSAVTDRRYRIPVWPWIVSLVVFLLWAIGGSIFVPGFYDQVVGREFLGRFGETIHRPQPFFFYFPHLLHKFFPWSVLILAFPVLIFREQKLDRINRSSLERIGAAFREISPETIWLICWSVGGLIVMSMVPSKRVDRIFPVVPPFCLLLAAQIGSALPNERIGRRVFQLSAVALVVAIAFAGGYGAFKVFTGYRDHRDALVLFGRTVRAVARQWRYEVVKSNDEGLLLYLEKLHFIDSDRATSEWNRGDLDALVVSEKDAPDLMRQLRDAAPSSLKSVKRDNEAGYILITR